MTASVSTTRVLRLNMQSHRNGNHECSGLFKSSSLNVFLELNDPYIDFNSQIDGKKEGKTNTYNKDFHRYSYIFLGHLDQDDR